MHDGGTYVCMEGPAFSTKAESLMNRNAFGGSVIGMTAVPECKLAREAEIAYCLVAMVTDYDSWHPDHAHVSVDMVRGGAHARCCCCCSAVVVCPSLPNATGCCTTR